MSYLSELEEAFAQEKDPAKRQLYSVLRRALGELRDWMRSVGDRIDPIERRMLLVDALPTEAPLGAIIRLRQGTAAERRAIYFGNGSGQPLTKLDPAVV